MENILTYFQFTIAALLIISILLQQRGEALGSAFGGEGGSFYAARRGAQKKFFWATIVLGTLFIIFSLLTFII